MSAYNISSRLIGGLLLMLVIGGCRKLDSDYGPSKGIKGTQSLNGFGTLRKAYSNAGFQTRDITRLTKRVKKSQVVVWIPTQNGVIPPNVTNWFERWLTSGDRTLVYIIPDSGSEAAYWLDAAKLAPADQRLEYRKRAAQSVNQRMQWRLNRTEIQSNGWFSAKPIPHPDELRELTGTWANNNVVFPHNQTNASDVAGGIQPEFAIFAYQPPQKKTAKTSGKPNITAPTTPPNTQPAGPTSPASIGWSLETETIPTRTKIEFESVLSDGFSDSIVATIRSKRWKNSQIIVVGGGSFVTNYGLTHPLGQRIATNIIAASQHVDKEYDRQFIKQVGFLTSNWQGVSISEQAPSVPQASGMELLTVWPISLVTIHGVLLGVIVCLVLFPIFGRARKVETFDQSDFSNHLDAVAALMSRTGGENYARQRISEYFKRIRGETSHPWTPPKTTSSPPRSIPGNSSPK